MSFNGLSGDREGRNDKDKGRKDKEGSVSVCEVIVFKYVYVWSYCIVWMCVKLLYVRVCVKLLCVCLLSLCVWGKRSISMQANGSTVSQPGG